MLKQFILLLSLFPLFALAQSSSDLVQYSGLLMSSDSLRSLPFAAIYDKKTGRGTYSNEQGFFSFVAQKGDTIVFSYVGFRTKYYVIPLELRDNKFSMIQLLAQDTLNLPITYIKPYPTPEEFKGAFLNLKIPDDDLERARKNLATMNDDQIRMSVPMDGTENANYAMQHYASTYYYKGQLPPQNIFNPLAWGEFFNAWNRGDFKRKKKKN